MNNGHQPATKQDLDQLRSDMDQKLDLLRSEMNHMSHDLVEQMRDSETNLLKAFYNYAETNNKRITMIEVANAGVQDRLAAMENRLLEVEKRLNMPPTV